MEETGAFRKSLEDVLETESLDKLCEYMERNIASFFSTPDIPVYYRMLKHIDFSISSKILPKLIMAWMAFLCGDHPGMAGQVNGICESELGGPQEHSFYYGLKALMGSMANPEEGYKYAELSLDILPKDEQSIFMANAQLTYGRLLSSADRYRLAAGMFAASYKTFYTLGLCFPGVVALVSEALCRYHLGEFERVIEKCNEALLMSSSFKDSAQTYWHVLHLPLGMCYFELNRPSLAIEHLKRAKASIDQFELFHMHGMIEWYLFKSYYILHDRAGMKKIQDEAVANFQHMHHKPMDLLISMFKVFSTEKLESHQIQPDIDKFEIEYSKHGVKSHSFVVDSLVFLRLNGRSDSIAVEDLEKILERLRYTGNIHRLQLTLLQLAEINYLGDKLKAASNYWKEAVQIYKEFGISAGFYMLPVKSIELLKKIDMKLFDLLNKRTQNHGASQLGTLLSAREKEIMQMIALGKTNEEMSSQLFISIGTIKWHINNIFGKLSVKNRVQAIMKAKSLGEI